MSNSRFVVITLLRDVSVIQYPVQSTFYNTPMSAFEQGYYSLKNVRGIVLTSIYVCDPVKHWSYSVTGCESRTQLI